MNLEAFKKIILEYMCHSQCANCRKWIPREYAIHDHVNGAWYCEKCYDEVQSIDDWLNSNNEVDD